jgi:acetoin utilization protein AcuB
MSWDKQAKMHRSTIMQSRKEDPMAMTGAFGKYGWMKVVDIMTKDPLIVTPSETIAQADELMVMNKIRQLPVVKERELIGIITDRDIRSFLSSSFMSAPETREKALRTKIGDVMTGDPLTLSPDDELREAVELLINEKVGGIPIVDGAEGIVGIVTYVDVLRCFLNRLQEEQS